MHHGHQLRDILDHEIGACFPQRGFGMGEPRAPLFRRQREKAVAVKPTPLPEADRPTVQQPARRPSSMPTGASSTLMQARAGQASSAISAFQVISGAGRPLGVSPAQTTTSGA